MLEPETYRVALIDDDKLLLKRLFTDKRIFHYDDITFEIEFYSDPSDFLTRLRQKTINVDALLLDINFENSTDLELAKIEPQPVPKAWAGLAILYMIKNHIDKSLPVIALTDQIAADGSIEMPEDVRRRENIASKADGYYSKNNLVRMLREQGNVDLSHLADAVRRTWRSVKTGG